MTAEVRADHRRLWSRLMDMAEIGATPAGGSNRQALSDEDKAGRELFIASLAQHGARTHLAWRVARWWRQP